jgi:hypothetical protein
LFENNIISSEAPAAPKYHIYCGLHADGNQFVANKLSGPCARAYVAAESAFDSTSSDPVHYAYKVGKSTKDMAIRGTSGVVFRQNTISVISAVPVFFLNQVTDSARTYPLSRCAISGNVVSGAVPTYYLRLSEQTKGALSELEFGENKFPPNAKTASFLAPRGVSHFAQPTSNVTTYIR